MIENMFRERHKNTNVHKAVSKIYEAPPSIADFHPLFRLTTTTKKIGTSLRFYGLFVGWLFVCLFTFCLLVWFGLVNGKEFLEMRYLGRQKEDSLLCEIGQII